MNWLISANNVIYNHSQSFKKNGYIDWHQTVKYSVEDIVYIYCTKPIKMVKYKTIVIRTNMDFSEITDDEEFWIDKEKYSLNQNGKHCRLQLLDEVYDERLSLDYLLENSLKAAPQTPVKMSERLSTYIGEIFANFQANTYIGDDYIYDEGKEKLQQHIIRERNQALIRRAKQKFKQEHNGRLFCEACNFDFSIMYGKLGNDFIEAHHTKPVSQMKPGEKTNINDIVMLCSNCHSMIHRSQKVIAKNDVRSIISKNQPSPKEKRIDNI